jgi:hypothetical protein
MSEARMDIAEERLEIAVEFIKRLISPEGYGLQLSDEVRRETYRTLCMIDDSYNQIRGQASKAASILTDK